MEKIVALHKHWLNADAIKQVVMTKIGSETTNFPNEIIELAEKHSSFARLSVHYGLIYVVIEGYIELKCQNKQIDILLEKNDFVDALRLFRNATFHYQNKSISEKLLKFLELKESEIWIRDLHYAFKLFLEKELHMNEILEKIKK